MARGKSLKVKQFEKILQVMVSGKPVTKEEIDATVGSEVYTYKLSTYLWEIKKLAGGVIKPIKDGRKVTAYQIVNPKDVAKYLEMREAERNAGQAPAQSAKVKKLKKLKDLQAVPISSEDTEVEPALAANEPVVEQNMPEVADSDVEEITEVQ